MTFISSSYLLSPPLALLLLWISLYGTVMQHLLTMARIRTTAESGLSVFKPSSWSLGPPRCTTRLYLISLVSTACRFCETSIARFANAGTYVYASNCLKATTQAQQCILSVVKTVESSSLSLGLTVTKIKTHEKSACHIKVLHSSGLRSSEMLRRFDW
jgi:hypothetical protein